MHFLSREYHLAFADSLPDSPETVIASSQLRCKQAEAWVDAWPLWETAVIDDYGQPGEPTVFGSPNPAVAALFAQNPHWFCLNVPKPDADLYTAHLHTTLGGKWRRQDDIYHTLMQPIPPANQPQVRELTPADAPLLAESGLTHDEKSHLPWLLAQRQMAGVVVNGRLVSLAQNYALSNRYGDIGVHTHPNHRGQGYATAAAAHIAQWLMVNGRVPVWSCGADNHASRRVAAKLGFRETSRRIYLIKESP